MLKRSDTADTILCLSNSSSVSDVTLGPANVTKSPNLPENPLFPAVDAMIFKGYSLVAAASKSVIGIYEGQRMFLVQTLEDSRSYLNSLAFCRDSGDLAACNDTEILLFSSRVSSHVPQAECPLQWQFACRLTSPSSILSVGWALNGRYIYSGGECLQAWDLPAINLSSHHNYPAGACWSVKLSTPVAFIAASPDNRLLASVSRYSKVVKVHWIVDRLDVDDESSVNTPGNSTTPSLSSSNNNNNKKLNPNQYVLLPHKRHVVCMEWRSLSSLSSSSASSATSSNPNSANKVPKPWNRDTLLKESIPTWDCTTANTNVLLTVCYEGCLRLWREQAEPLGMTMCCAAVFAYDDIPVGLSAACWSSCVAASHDIKEDQNKQHTDVSGGTFLGEILAISKNCEWAISYDIVAGWGPRASLRAMETERWKIDGMLKATKCVPSVLPSANAVFLRSLCNPHTIHSTSNTFSTAPPTASFSAAVKAASSLDKSLVAIDNLGRALSLALVRVLNPVNDACCDSSPPSYDCKCITQAERLCGHQSKIILVRTSNHTHASCVATVDASGVIIIWQTITMSLSPVEVRLSMLSKIMKHTTQRHRTIDVMWGGKGDILWVLDAAGCVHSYALDLSSDTSTLSVVEGPVLPLNVRLTHLTAVRGWRLLGGGARQFLAGITSDSAELVVYLVQQSRNAWPARDNEIDDSPVVRETPDVTEISFQQLPADNYCCDGGDDNNNNNNNNSNDNSNNKCTCVASPNADGASIACAVISKWSAEGGAFFAGYADSSVVLCVIRQNQQQILSPQTPKPTWVVVKAMKFVVGSSPIVRMSVAGAARVAVVCAKNPEAATVWECESNGSYFAMEGQASLPATAAAIAAQEFHGRISRRVEATTSSSPMSPSSSAASTEKFLNCISALSWTFLSDSEPLLVLSGESAVCVYANQFDSNSNNNHDGNNNSISKPIWPILWQQKYPGYIDAAAWIPTGHVVLSTSNIIRIVPTHLPDGLNRRTQSRTTPQSGGAMFGNSHVTLLWQQMIPDHNPDALFEYWSIGMEKMVERIIFDIHKAVCKHLNVPWNPKQRQVTNIWAKMDSEIQRLEAPSEGGVKLNNSAFPPPTPSKSLQQQKWEEDVVVMGEESFRAHVSLFTKCDAEFWGVQEKKEKPNQDVAAWGSSDGNDDDNDNNSNRRRQSGEEDINSDGMNGVHDDAVLSREEVCRLLLGNLEKIKAMAGVSQRDVSKLKAFLAAVAENWGISHSKLDLPSKKFLFSVTQSKSLHKQQQQHENCDNFGNNNSMHGVTNNNDAKSDISILYEDMAWALMSENQEAIIDAVLTDPPTWSEFAALGIPLWLQSNAKLRQLAEKIAKGQFMKRKDSVDSALTYLCLGRKTTLLALLKASKQDKLYNFLVNDFREERWQKAAVKNAFVLLGQHKYELAVCFFVLGNALSDAVDVCLRNLEDTMLALFVARLVENGDDGPIHTKVLQELCAVHGFHSRHEDAAAAPAHFDDTILAEEGGTTPAAAAAAGNPNPTAIVSPGNTPSNNNSNNSSVPVDSSSQWLAVISLWRLRRYVLSADSLIRISATVNPIHALRFYEHLVYHPIVRKQDKLVEGSQIDVTTQYRWKVSMLRQAAYKNLKDGVLLLALRHIIEAERVIQSSYKEEGKEEDLMHDWQWSSLLGLKHRIVFAIASHIAVSAPMVEEEEERSDLSDMIEENVHSLVELCHLEDLIAAVQHTCFKSFHLGALNVLCGPSAHTPVITFLRQSSLSICSLLTSLCQMNPTSESVKFLPAFSSALAKLLVDSKDLILQASKNRTQTPQSPQSEGNAPILPMGLANYVERSGRWEAGAAFLVGLFVYCLSERDYGVLRAVVTNADGGDGLVGGSWGWGKLAALADTAPAFNWAKRRSSAGGEVSDMNTSIASDLSRSDSIANSMRLLTPIGDVEWVINAVINVMACRRLYSLLIDHKDQAVYEKTASTIAIDIAIAGIDALWRRLRQRLLLGIPRGTLGEPCPLTASVLLQARSIASNGGDARAMLWDSLCHLSECRLEFESALTNVMSRCLASGVSNTIANTQFSGPQEITRIKNEPIRSLCVRQEDSHEHLVVLGTAKGTYETLAPFPADPFAVIEGEDPHKSTDMIDSLKAQGLAMADDWVEYLGLDFWTSDSIAQGVFKVTQIEKTGALAVAAHPYHPLYVSGNSDGTVLMYNFCACCPVSAYTWPSVQPPLYHIRFSPCGSSFAACNGTGLVAMWHFSPSEVIGDNMRPYLSWQSHSKRCQDSCFLNSMSVLSTVGTSSDKIDACVWDTLLPQSQRRIIGLSNFGDSGGKSCHYLKDERALLTGGRQGDLIKTDTRMWKTVGSVTGAHKNSVKSICSSPCERFVFTGGRDGDIKVWDARNLNLMHTWKNVHSKPSTVATLGVAGVLDMFVDESFVISCGADGRVVRHAYGIPSRHGGIRGMFRQSMQAIAL